MKIKPLIIPGLDQKASRLVAKKGMQITAPEGTLLFEPGKHCQLFYFLTSGVIRVQIVAESGREIVLYRVGPGQACVMTVSCLMGHGIYNGEGIVEQDASGYAIALPLFTQLLSQSESFRNTLLGDYADRFFNLVNLLENVVFKPLEARLAVRLLQLEGGVGQISCTHQMLATDLGSAREVISRLLKAWEEKGIVRLQRGKIEVRSCQLLKNIADISA